MLLSPLLVTGGPDPDLRAVSQLIVRIGLANPVVRGYWRLVKKAL